MCGIAGGTHLDTTPEQVCDILHHRGPDDRGHARIGPFTLAHTRLAIRDLDRRSAQPFTYRHIRLVYNGELWNAEHVRDQLARDGYQFATTGDTEILAAALDRWGAGALDRLDGMWAFAWHDQRDPELIRAATDRYGETPLHVAPTRAGWAFASELKALPTLGASLPAAVHAGPGAVVTIPAAGKPARARWHRPPIEPAPHTLDDAATALRGHLAEAARRRAVADVPVCALLSGGIDSAATVALLKPHIPGLVAYTGVLDPRSRDLRHARITADAVGVPLVEVKIPEPSADDLARVVAAIEQPHKAQVEIGWACLHLADAAADDGHKVVLTGEGSDELWASYGMAYHGIRRHGWHEYRRDLFLAQHRKNFARVNKVFLARGVEPRLPFLHPPLVEHALSLPRDAVADGKSRPKAVLQRAVADLLPREVVDRPKVAFQDGLGLKDLIARTVTDPARLYRAEYRNQYGRAAA